MNATTAVHHLLTDVTSAVQTTAQAAEQQFRPAIRSKPDADELLSDLDGFALRGPSGLAYNEEAFHYLLNVERRRAELAGRPFLLMLIECDDAGGVHARGNVVTAGRLFPILFKCLRETDFTGWYRQGAVVGAVLTQDARRRTENMCGVVRERIGRALDRDLPPELVERLQLRLYEVVGDGELRSE